MKKTLLNTFLSFCFFIVGCGTPATPPSSSPKPAAVKPSGSGGTPAKPAPPKIINIPGFSEGNDFNVDGPLWYDGTAKLHNYNDKLLKLGITMSAPDIGGAYAVRDGKINIVIQLTKADNIYRLTIIDQNNNKNYAFGQVKVQTGKIEAGFFSKEKQTIKITAQTQEFNFIINEAGKVSVTASSIPGSLDLVRKDLA